MALKQFVVNFIFLVQILGLIQICISTLITTIKTFSYCHYEFNSFGRDNA